MSDIKSIDWLERLQKDGYCIIPDLSGHTIIID